MTIPPIETRIIGNNADAQAKIRETVAAVQRMARAVNLESRAAQQAMRSEIESARERLALLNATERQRGKVETVSRRVESAIEQSQHRYAAASRQVARGLENVIRTGNLAGQGLREMIASAGDIAFAFGPAGAVAGAIAFVALGFVHAFTQAREEIEKTRQKAIDEFTALADQMDVQAVLKKMQLLESGTATERFGGVSKEDRERVKRLQELGVTGSVAGLKGRRAAIEQLEALTSQSPGTIGSAGGDVNLTRAVILFGRRKEELERLKEEIKPLQEQFDRMRQFVLNPPAPLSDVSALPGVEITAQSDATRAAERAKSGAALEAERARRDREIQRQQARIAREGLGNFPLAVPNMQPINPQLPKLETPEFDLSKSIDSVSTLDAVLGELRDSLDRVAEGADHAFEVFPAIASAAGESIKGVAESAIGAAIAGRGKVIKQLKAAAAEPMVAKLKMDAVDELVDAARAAARGNFASAGAHLLAAGKATAGAVIVARLGGIGGGGGPGGSAGGAAGAAARGRQDAERLEGSARQRTEIIIQGGLLDMSDPRQRDALAKAFEDLQGVGNVTIRAG